MKTLGIRSFKSSSDIDDNDKCVNLLNSIVNQTIEQQEEVEILIFTSSKNSFKFINAIFR